MPTFPAGHFYSPLVDPQDLRRRADHLWGAETRVPLGIDLALDDQWNLLEDARSVAAEFAYPASEEAITSSREFRDNNGVFESLDARILYCILRMRRPRRMVEVGSGHSTLLSADVNTRWLKGRTELICIEPYPPEFLTELPSGVSKLIRERVEEIGIEPFLALKSGDILFIDSSHVSKTGSDVNHLYFEVLPRLAPGVLIHIHDIFMPEEYPRDWVLEEERSWNEQYLLRALLMFSGAFRVVFGSHCASLLLPDQVESVFGAPHGGGSFWIEKIS